jgi:hypothetical protein
MDMKMNIRTMSLIACVAATLSGCAAYEENKQLTSINKDWNRLIRASHIYPVYPLSQDIMPGDIFLVSSDIEDVQAWNQPGYLPLDHLVARLYPTNFITFYTNSWSAYNDLLPRAFLKDNSWSNAPVAGFPSYSFTVTQGAGANVALPIQGIPVGLGIMGAKQASGYVTLADAHTYGVDEMSLRNQVWSYIRANEDQLSYLLAPDQTNYLQVVTRVYVVGQVTVSMVNDSSTGGSVWGGSPKDVPIPVLRTNDAAGNYTNMLSAVNSSIPAASAVSSILPGGTFKFSSASSRSVSMSESFPQPIVVGYNGFSFAIAKKEESYTNRCGLLATRMRILLGECIISNAKLLSIYKKSQGHFASAGKMEGSFENDAASKKLREWVVDPKDNTKYIPEHEEALKKWMERNCLKDVDIGPFLDLSNFADERAQAVNDLGVQ